jgi:predicted nucleic acid-binding protein
VKYLLDASALLLLTTGRGKQLIVEASRENLITTDLAMYEACNSLWKLATLLKTMPLEDAMDVATTLKNLVMRNMIQTINFAKLDFSHALNKAYKEQLTFYDASYIATAESTEAILVTEDKKLRKAAGKFVKTITYTDLADRLTQR